MYQPYFDITEKLGTPLWWDENGVPRYQPFEPRLCADIYFRYAALIEIRCQGCGQTFPVAATWSVTAHIGSRYDDVVWDKTGHNPQPKSGLPKERDAGFCCYGDAPFHPLGGQCSGTTMTTSVVRILEFWGREGIEEKRLAEHEVYIGEDEEDEP